MTILDGHGLCSYPTRINHLRSSLTSIKKVQNEKETCITLIRIGHGEFKNENFQLFSKENDILHNFSTP